MIRSVGGGTYQYNTSVRTGIKAITDFLFSCDPQHTLYSLSIHLEANPSFSNHEHIHL